MYCSSCGASNPEGISVCGACGTPLSPSDPGSSRGRAASEVPRQLHAMRVGDIMDEMIRLYRRNFRTFIGIVAVLQVPLAILQMLQYAIVGPTIYGVPAAAAGSQSGALIFWLASSFVLGIIGFLSFLVYQAALASAISDRYLSRQITVGRAYRAALACFWRMFGVTLLVGMLLILVAITLIGIPFAIYLGIRWSFVIQALVLEGTPVRKSLSRSSSLVKGSWWRVLGVIVLVGIAQYLVVALPAGIIGAGVGMVAILLFPTATFLVLMINGVIGALFNILAAPIMPTVSTLLYYDLRIRKEGFDLQVLAERLSQNLPPAAESQI